MKNSITLAVSLLSLTLYAQVGINNNAPKATLDITAKTTDGSKPEGLIAPRLTGDQIQAGDAQYGAAQKGSIVYATAAATSPSTKTANITTQGYYFFDGTVWNPFTSSITNTISGGFNTSILGYTPVPYAQKVTVTTAPGGATVTELGCKTNPANGHVYCAYQLSAEINYANAYALAKQIGGYLVTMTSNAERIWVNTNLVNSGTGYNLANSIWIGYAKIATPGNNFEFKWITGEEFTVNWGINPTLATVENWFNSGEPNNSGGSEGYCHIISQVFDPQRRWNDRPGDITTGINQLIIEFNE